MFRGNSSCGIITYYTDLAFQFSLLTFQTLLINTCDISRRALVDDLFGLTSFISGAAIGLSVSYHFFYTFWYDFNVYFEL